MSKAYQKVTKISKTHRTKSNRNKKRTTKKLAYKRGSNDKRSAIRI